jgi:hypothetical protein
MNRKEIMAAMEESFPHADIFIHEIIRRSQFDLVIVLYERTSTYKGISSTVKAYRTFRTGKVEHGKVDMILDTGHD